MNNQAKMTEFEKECNLEDLKKKWGSKDVMIKHYQALVEFRALLDKAIEKTAKELPEEIPQQSGFDGWPSPNPFYKVSQNHIFIETYGTGEYFNVYRLWTPFGELIPLGSGMGNVLHRCSHNLFWDANLKIEKVTTQVRTVPCNEKESDSTIYWHHLNTFHRQPWSGSGVESNIYVIKSIRDIIYDEPSQIDLLLFDSRLMSTDRYNHHKELFRIISKNSNMF